MAAFPKFNLDAFALKVAQFSIRHRYPFQPSQKKDTDIAIAVLFVYLCSQMKPDYPHKRFNDLRRHYTLLMEALAMDNTLL